MRLGFARNWVNIVMQCVSSVSYSFNVNANVCGAVSPSRGLRQGDPLSSYLFIMVTYAFSSLLRKAVAEDVVHGAKGSTSGPRISHHLFARANRRECSKIV